MIWCNRGVLRASVVYSRPLLLQPPIYVHLLYTRARQHVIKGVKVVYTDDSRKRRTSTEFIVAVTHERRELCCYGPLLFTHNASRLIYWRSCLCNKTSRFCSIIDLLKGYLVCVCVCTINLMWLGDVLSPASKNLSECSSLFVCFCACE